MLGPTQVTTALVEEPVVVGLLVVLLTAARRPVWEVYTAAVLAKVAYHLAYGLPVLALVPAALVIVLLYHRTGRLWPVILAHAAYNLCFSALVIGWPTIFG
ncbi:CPBP family glutamic-type intramembrane protease [Nocardiopsis synnemataformans]|uniref:CPBP family glutamic-type intramembrane protease n=1 Tax=Nocardiopsis synnemataformans TaxID=61305 RepID=UPI003EBA7397